MASIKGGIFMWSQTLEVLNPYDAIVNRPDNSDKEDK